MLVNQQQQDDTLEQVRYFFYHLYVPLPTEPPPLDATTTALLLSENMLSAQEQTQLLLYDIFIPLLGSLIIVLNLAVVTSSWLLLRKGLIVSTTVVSVYSIGLIAVDRYLYIMYGLQHQRYITPARARLSIFTTWLIGLTIGFLPAFGWRGDTDGGRICWFVRLAPPALIILTTTVGLFPLIVVIVLYGIILHKALRRVVQLKKAGREQQGALAGNLRLFRGGATAASSPNLDSERPLTEGEQKSPECFGWCCKKSSSKPTDTRTGKHPTKWKAIKVVLFTTGCFAVTWLPYYIASVLFVLCNQETNAELCRSLQFAIASPLAILGFTNSLLNPLIYAWWHNGFRASVKKLWRKMCLRHCCCCQRNNNKSSTREPPAPTSTSTGESTGSGEGQQSSNTDATTLPSSNNRSVANMYNNRSSSSSNSADLENRITHTDIDRPDQTRL
ncbi:5-hydroxytryptamine receptor 1B-like isoform X2 [Toxorhynchites rutilus septentrionalis]|uniref:5-hydroxytryptamine receptor 1B-like isoform X2 n=1 Tax=Toxorhynchites rutilus septentrionalis TaxID=329112 RepID=UPI002479B3E4|nr:5-hydroxytryptamine receptor 1B-like isoform X2 [Toxorhynchites rutilus septentrionalis]